MNVDLPLPFENLSQSLQNKLNQEVKHLTYTKNGMPIVSDDLLDSVYVVKQGKIKCYQLNLDTGKEQTLYIYKDNHIFDTVTLLDGELHDVCYEVLEDTQLMVFPMDFVRNLLQKYPEFSQKFYLYISKQMRYLEETLTDISLYSVSERLIKLIIQDYQPNNLFRFNILDGLSHSESAKLIGTVRHVVERHLKALKKEKLIDITKHKIQITDTTLLLDKIRLLG